MTQQNRYSVIILAAGFSSRLERFKPLLDLGGDTMTDRVIAMFAQNGVDVLLVVGWNKGELLTGIKSRNMTVVENPDYQKGMFTSVLAGVRRLPTWCESFFVMPVDVPLVRPATVQRLLDEAAGHPGNIIYPCFKKRRGHPPLVPSNLIPDIFRWTGDGGLRAFLDGRKDMERDVSVPDRNILFDIDAANDLQEAKERLQRYETPTREECEVIMDMLHPRPSAVRRHCEKVAEVAVAIGSSLQEGGQEIDLKTVHAAAFLHDMAKGMPNHEKEAFRMLHDMGFGKTGDLVADHTELIKMDGLTPIEEKVVYLADKFVEEDCLVSLEERYRTQDRKFIITPEIEAKILQRKARALNVKNNFEEILGGPLEEIVFSGHHGLNSGQQDTMNQMNMSKGGSYD